MKELEDEVKNMIIDTLNLEDITAADIDSNDPLFGDGLGLDSIDALEIGLALKAAYNITVDPDDKNIRTHFENVANLVKFIQARSS